MKRDSDQANQQLQMSFATPYLSIDQVAALIGVPKSFIYRRTARGHDDPIPHYRIGRHLRFNLSEIEAWIEQHRADDALETAAALVAAIRERSSSISTKVLTGREKRR